MRHTSLSLLLGAAMASAAIAQCNTVTTLTGAGNGQNGTMFNIVNISANPVTIQAFEQCFILTAADSMRVYTKTGTWSGFENNAGAWTLVGQATAVHGFAPTLDALPIPINVTIPAGATQAFYITGDTISSLVAYTDGVNGVGSVIGADANIQVLGGIGKQYPFGPSFGLPTAGRLWNGRVLYGSNCQRATNTALGVGCIGASNSFYELHTQAFTASTALPGNALLLVPNGSGYAAAWLPGAAASLFVAPVTPTNLATGDDGEVVVTPSIPLATPYGPQASLRVSGNGMIAFGAAAIDFPGGTFAYEPTANAFLNSIQGGIYAWHDFNVAEAGSGPIQREEIGGTLYITFNDVESYAFPEVVNRSTMQFQLELATGVVNIVWNAVSGNSSSDFGSAWLIGVTAPGASQNPGSVSLATALPQQLLTASPEVTPFQLAATSRPLIGGSWNLSTNNIPPTSVFGVEVLGLTDPGINDLFFIGMPGCGLRANLDLINAFLVTGPTHTWGLPIPNDPNLIGFQLFATSAVSQTPPVNAFGFVTSDGQNGSLGSY